MGNKYRDRGKDGSRASIRHQICRDPTGFLPYKQLRNQQQQWATKSFHAEPGRDEVDKYLQQWTLQVDIAKISHRESRRAKLNGVFHGTTSVPLEEISSCRVRCSVTISTQEQGEQLAVFFDSQVCDIKTFRTIKSARPEARFVGNSFYVPSEKLFVQRDDGQGFALADSYSIRVEFRPAGDHWPPPELVPREHEDVVNAASPPNSKKWVLSATIPNICHHNQNRKPTPIMLRKEHQVECATDFTVDIDAQWCSSLWASSTVQQDKGDAQPSIAVDGANERLQLSPPQINGHVHDCDHKMVDGFDTDRMPNGALDGILEGPDSPSIGSGTTLVNVHFPKRMPASAPVEDKDLKPRGTKRTRTEVNYNFRHMRNAVGKEYKNRRKNTAGDALGVKPTRGITYILPKEQVEVEGFRCFVCGEMNNSVTQLRAHLSTHSSYIFEQDGSGGRHLYINVSHNMDNPGAALGPQAFNLGFSAKPLDLEKIIDGDMSWVTSRLDPENGADLEVSQVPLTEKTHPALSSRPVTAPRRKSQKNALQKKVVIPNIKQALYDPVSKAQLEPGSEYRTPVLDGSWIAQKHRDTLMDFVDVEPDEKEYMREWDAFILQKHLTTAKYLPKAYLALVRSKASWIVAKPQRGIEFAKHSAMLLARSAIDNLTLHEATLIFTDARKDMQANGAPPEAPKSPPRGPDRCAHCHEIVSRPAMLVCASKTCQHRLYHKTCGKQLTGQAPKNWLCPGCHTLPAA